MLKRILSSDPISTDFGLFVIRLGVGLSVVIFHGYDKLMGGPETWAKLGGSMANLHITSYPVVWGFMSAFAESICSRPRSGIQTAAASPFTRSTHPRPPPSTATRPWPSPCEGAFKVSSRLAP